MRYRRVRGDDQIEVHHDRGCVHERPSDCIHVIAEIDEGQTVSTGRGGFRVSVALLQADQAHARHFRQGPEALWRNVSDARDGSPPPVDADSQPARGLQSLVPQLNERRVGAKIRNLSRDRVQRRLYDRRDG